MRGVERHRGPASRAARRGRARRRRGRDIAVLVRRERERGRLRACAAGLRRHRPAHAEPRSRRGRRRRHRAHDRAAAGAHLRLPRRPARLRAPRPADRRGRLRGARRGPRRRHAGRRPRHPAVFGFYANKQLTTGEGGMVTTADDGRQGAHRLRAQPGPRAGHGLARPRPPRLQLPADRHRLRARARPARAPRCACSPSAPRVAALYREALAGIEGLELPCEDRGGDRRGWFVFVVQLPRERRPRRHASGALRERGSSPSPTCRRST